MKNYYICVCLFIAFGCNAQSNTMLTKKRGNECEKRNDLKHYRYDVSFPDSTLVDYLINSKSVPIKYISNLSNQKEVKTEFRTSDYLIFKNDSIKIQMTFAKDSLTNPTLAIEKNSDEAGINYVSKVNGHEPIGLLFEQNNFTSISSCQITLNNQVFEVPEEIYKNLYSPNIFEKYKSLTPIQSFLSHDKSMVYIYVMGNNRKIDEVSDRSISATYMAKIIFELENKTFKRYILLYPELMVYGFDCLEFDGF